MNLMNNQLEKAAAPWPAARRKSGKPGLVQRIKPLIFNPEIECALYAQFNNIAFHRGGCPYAGESSRGAVKDFLNTSGRTPRD